MSSLGAITLNEMEIHEVDVSPVTSGVDAPIGSLAIVTDGSFIFLKTTTLSTGWSPITPLTFLEYVYTVTANQTSTSNVYANVTQLTTTSLPIGTYTFNCYSICQSTAVATGVGLRLSSSGVGAAVLGTVFAKWDISLGVDGTDKDFQYNQITPTDNVSSTAARAANVNFLATGTGIFTITTAGTVSVQLRSETANAVSIRAGSIFFIKKVA